MSTKEEKKQKVLDKIKGRLKKTKSPLMKNELHPSEQNKNGDT